MQNIPQELLAVYAQVIRNAPHDQAAAAHLVNFLIDVETVGKAISDAIEQVKVRAQQPQ